MTAQQLQAARTRLHLTRQQLAEQSSYSVEAIRSMEYGRRKVSPKLAAFIRVLFIIENTRREQ